MLKKTMLVLALGSTLAACAAEQPRIVQATGDMQEVHLTGGMATQVELPSSMRAQSVVVGNPNLVTAERADNVVNLVPKEGASGETNLIVRAVDDDGHAKIFQYRLTVQGN